MPDMRRDGGGLMSIPTGASAIGHAAACNLVRTTLLHVSGKLEDGLPGSQCDWDEEDCCRSDVAALLRSLAASSEAIDAICAEASPAGDDRRREGLDP